MEFAKIPMLNLFLKKIKINMGILKILIGFNEKF
jgi:hypothetical protein